MINLAMRTYDYFTFGELDEYGQPQLSETAQGTIKMAIHLTTQSVADNIKYSEAQYIGLTLDANVNDTYVIEFGEQKLKVLYVNAFGRLKQVYLCDLA